jgi:hypothetical protein
MIFINLKNLFSTKFVDMRLLIFFFWVLPLCRVTGRCQCFGQAYCLRLQGLSALQHRHLCTILQGARTIFILKPHEIVYWLRNANWKNWAISGLWSFEGTISARHLYGRSEEIMTVVGWGQPVQQWSHSSSPSVKRKADLCWMKHKNSALINTNL